MSGLFIPLSWEDQMDTGAQGRGQGSIPPPFRGDLQIPFLPSWGPMPSH